MENPHYFSRVLKGLGLDSLSQVFKNISPKLRANNQKGLRILVTGKSSQGKSALINGLLGAKVAVEGARASELTTKEVMVISTTLSGVPIKVFDSPGLQDTTGNEAVYIQKMIDQCRELSLVLYCTKMTDPRLTDADKKAMMTLTKSFGENFWNYAVFVLTFANMEDIERRDSRDLDNYTDPTKELPESIKKQRFENRLKIWQHSLYDFLMKEVGVNADIAISIPVVPTGDRKKTRRNRNPLRLPGRDNWFHSFWEVCCLRIKETSLFLEINNGRMVDITGNLPTIQEEEEQCCTPTTPKKLDDSISSADIICEAETDNDDSKTQKDDTQPQQQTPVTKRQKSNEDLELESQDIPVRYKFVKDMTKKIVRQGYVEDPKDIELINGTFKQNMQVLKKDAVPQLGDVVRQFAPIAFKWNEIGLYLNVPHGVLMSEAHNPIATDIVRLGNTIQSWLDSTVAPSWNILLRVVESDLKNMRLGMDIRHFLLSEN